MAGFLSFQVASFLFVPAASYILYSQWAYRKRSKGLPLPPGPKGWPVIGNVFDVPLAGMALVYAQWAKSFGESNLSRPSRARESGADCFAGSDIVSASVLGDTIVVIDSYDTAIELLEKRASKYSSRCVRQSFGTSVDQASSHIRLDPDWLCPAKSWVGIVSSPSTPTPRCGGSDAGCLSSTFVLLATRMLQVVPPCTRRRCMSLSIDSCWM